MKSDTEKIEKTTETKTISFNAKPAITLCVITAVISAILVITSSFIPDTSNKITPDLQDGCVALMGEGEYEIISDWKKFGSSISKPDNVNKLIVKKGSGLKDRPILAFEITTGGYKPPDGITVLVTINHKGQVSGVVPILIKDDPGVGDRVDNEIFLGSFKGASEKVTIVKQTPKDNEIMTVTGATYSAKGVAEAVNIAIETHRQMLENSEIDNK